MTENRQETERERENEIKALTAWGSQLSELKLNVRFLVSPALAL